MNNKKRIWIVPANDLESIRIGEILELHGEEYFTTSQKWGASWDRLEKEIKDVIDGLTDCIVYGVELQGVPDLPAGVFAVNIDHHKYNDNDRSHRKSSLEQVIDVVGHGMTVWDRAVSANDTHYIPGIIELCETLDMPASATGALVNTIRRKDREAQGVTPKDEQLAEEDLEHIGPDSVMVVGCRTDKCSVYTDRLYGLYETLILISQEGEVNIFAPNEIINRLNDLNIQNSWSGGGEENGFWGCTQYSRIPEILEEIYRDLVFLD